jgi:hypothetical protein
MCRLWSGSARERTRPDAVVAGVLAHIGGPAERACMFEVSVAYETVEELEELLPASDYEREPLPTWRVLLPGKRSCAK